MPGPLSLSEQEVQQLRAELAAGAPPTVWFTSSAVGVSEGRSGKVMAFTEPDEGDFVQVRPSGSNDVLSFSPAELTLVKPPRKRATPATSQEVATIASAPEVAPVVPSGPSEPAAAPVESALAQPSTVSSEGEGGGVAGRPQRAAGGGRRQRVAEVAVTLSGTSDGEWAVEVVAGKRRTVRALSVTVAAVAKAAKMLHPDVAEAIEDVLAAAREQQLAKVEQLSAELAEARRMLVELGEPAAESE